MTHIARIGTHLGTPIVRVAPVGSDVNEVAYMFTVGPSRVASDTAAFVLDDNGWAITGWWTPEGTVTVTRKDTR